jgi:zinc-ribbon domain
MAAFCTSCGSPLAEGQVFCTKCGARAGAPQAAAAPPPATPVQGAPGTPAAAPPTYSPAAAASAAPAPAAATGGGGAFIKILLIVVGVIFVFGAIGVGAVVYIGYRVKQKAREMGLTSEHLHQRRPDALGRTVDGCKWLSKEEVSAAIGMTVVRAESTSGSDPGCSYTVMGDVGELTMKHAMQLNKAQAKEMSKQDQEKMENIGKTILGGASGINGNSEHPGEVVVLALGVDENAAQFQMKLNRGMLNGLGPMATQNVPDLGDEAFAAAGSMLLVRKGETLLRMTYTQCPCSTDEMIPLARKVAGAL